MDEILHQLGDLFLGSVPTVILFLFLVVFYQVLVYRPLMRVLRERRERTEGAIEKANAAIAEADARAQEYEARLRSARAAIFEARKRRLAEWAREREAALTAAREAAEKQVAAARAVLEAESEAARRRLESSAGQLAGEILKAVLPSDMAMAESGR